MTIIEQFAKRLGYAKVSRKPPQVRGYDAAVASRLTGDWFAPITTGDAEIRNRLKPLRARCRELERNNPYFQSWLGAIESNVLGRNGVGMQMKIRDKGSYGPGGKYMLGPLDDYANRTISEAYAEFSDKANFTVTGLLSRHAASRLALRTVARDGDVLVRFVRGPAAQNKWNFAIQLIEPDLIDVDYNTSLPNGGQIRMGVEFDQYMRRTAVYVLKSDPGDLYQWSQFDLRHDRIPATDFIMPYIPWRISQSRGVPWACGAMQGLQMLDGYQEAELVAARTAAAKMGFLTQTTPDGYGGQLDNVGNISMEAEPGSIQSLPMGVDFKPWDPTHPSSAYPSFVKTTLRGIAAGLQVSYNRLANDLEGVNFSSMRSGLMEEREVWMMLQTWEIDQFEDPIFEGWLEMAMLSGEINLPMAKYDKFNAPEWQPRRWNYVNPLQDIEADIAAVNAGMKSRSECIRDTGGDPEELDAEIAEDKARAAALGLSFVTEIPSTKIVDAGNEGGSPLPSPNPSSKVANKDLLN